MRADLRAKRPLLYQEVVNALYQIIDTSNLKPGDQMPAERELMEQLGVSRNVLREAFHILEQRGIITSQQGKGRFLREIPISQLGEDKQEEMSKNLERYSLYEAYEVRQVLETKAMDLIVRNATDSDRNSVSDDASPFCRNKHNHRRIRAAPALCQKNWQRFYGTDAEHRIINNSRNDAHNFS